MILVLVVVWGGVLAWWFMNRPESHSADSIGSFRHQLRVLERTGPTTVNPAFRMQTHDLGVYGARRVPTMSLAGAGRPLTPAARRRQAQKRRRDVFCGLSASVLGAFVLGFLPGLGVMWWLAALLAAVLALYVVVLVQMKAAAAERTQKVRFLASARPAPVSHAEPAYLLRRSAN